MRTTIAVVGLLALACTTTRQPVLHKASDAQALSGRTDTLKVHHRSGALDVLVSWSVDGDSVLNGTGVRYTALRAIERNGALRTPFDSIALLESNNPRVNVSPGMATLAVWGIYWGALTIACVAEPKSCFGSCPTFYIDDVDRDRPLAEGFSSSIARSLEARDVDDLGVTKPGGSAVHVRMTNEAWETHAVRRVRLLAVPMRDGTAIHATADGAFMRVRGAVPPGSCASGGLSCAAAVAARDGDEWHTPTDASDLAARDTIVLAFPPQSGELGLVLAARQSFVSTFVLYQTMAYLGTNAGTWLARLESGDRTAVAPLDAVNAMIGTIEIDVMGQDGWRRAGTYSEAGPIATDVQLIPVGASFARDSVRVRLTFAKGNWRIGRVALGVVEGPVQPVVIEPASARRIGAGGASVRDVLLADDRHLFTYPDDAIAMRFELPAAAPAYALFLESQGYYYEWMRGAWFAEEDARMAGMLMLNPRQALREMAPAFKVREAEFETSFWNSRFGQR